MQVLTIQKQGDLGEYIERIPQAIRETRAEVIKTAADLMSGLLNANIEASGIQDGNGSVRSWQQQYFGSGGGYVAVRAKAKTYKVTPHGKRYAIGMITNALEHGHKLRYPSGRSKRYKPEIHMARARAFQFYHSSAELLPEVEQIAKVTFETKMASTLEG